MSNFESEYGLKQSFDELQASVAGRAAKIRVSEELLIDESTGLSAFAVLSIIAYIGIFMTVKGNKAIKSLKNK